MKYTIMGFQQQKLLDNDLDTVDALILSVIKDMYSSNSMEYKTINDLKFMWINYNYFLSQVPIIGSRNNLIRRIKKYSDKLLLLKEIKFERNGNKGTYMYLYPTEKLYLLSDYEGYPKLLEGYSKITGGDTQNEQEGYSKRVDKDTSIKDTSIKDTNNILSFDNDIAFRTDIINYLNDKSNKHYKPNTSKTKTVIGARLKEGFTLDDFKTVIDKKVKQWLGNDMDKYLRPETLFGTKFESYLNESETNGTNNTSNKQTIDQNEIDAFLRGDY